MADTHRYLLQILLGLNRTADTLDPLKRTLATLTPEERLRSIGLLPRLDARVTDKKLAASMVEQALAPDLGKASTGPSAWAAVGLLRVNARGWGWGTWEEEEGGGQEEGEKPGTGAPPLSHPGAWLSLWGTAARRRNQLGDP